MDIKELEEINKPKWIQVPVGVVNRKEIIDGKEVITEEPRYIQVEFDTNLNWSDFKKTMADETYAIDKRKISLDFQIKYLVTTIKSWDLTKDGQPLAITYDNIDNYLRVQGVKALMQYAEKFGADLQVIEKKS